MPKLIEEDSILSFAPNPREEKSYKYQLFIPCKGDDVDKKTIYSVLAGIVLYAVVIALANVQRDLTGSQLILMLAAPLVVGILSGGIKKGLMLGFLVPFAMLIVEFIIIYPGAFTNPNVAAAVAIMNVLPFAALSMGLGAAGGLIGRRIFKSEKGKSEESKPA